jgi:methyl coenzyme M reductase alpha subunit
MEIEQYIFSEGGFANIINQVNITKCYDDIERDIRTTLNASFTVINSTRDAKIIVDNINEPNDHINHYIVTLSDTAETYMIEEVVYPLNGGKPNKNIIKHFKKSN